jgi:hypothetical protein
MDDVAAFWMGRCEKGHFVSKNFQDIDFLSFTMGWRNFQVFD